jgi:hypothetical protein
MNFNLFTGQHINFSDEKELNQNNIEKYVGLLVCSTGRYKFNCQYNGEESKILQGKDAIKINDALPIIELCRTKKK